MPEEKKHSMEIIGKTIVSKAGKKFGVVGDLVFETRTGELIYLLLDHPTEFAGGLNLEKSRDGGLMVPFSSVMSVGDFVIISEEDII
jgi:sporulation protein YlmC with PRC-barrel domain